MFYEKKQIIKTYVQLLVQKIIIDNQFYSKARSKFI